MSSTKKKIKKRKDLRKKVVFIFMILIIILLGISLVYSFIIFFTGKDVFWDSFLMDSEEINNKLLFERIQLSKSWVLNNINDETKTLQYKYFPNSSSYSSDNNHVRQLASLWSVIMLKNFLNDDSFEELITDTLDYYLDYKTCLDDYCYLTINNKSKLAFNAFLVLNLVNYPEYPNSEELLEKFANGIILLQNKDGSYNTYFNSDRNTGTDYYPGEAMLALMKFYGKTGKGEYIESVQNAFPYYRNYWRENKNTAFIPWHTQTYLLLYKETNDPELAKFVFEINDWLIDNYQITNSSNLNEVGGFPKDNPKCSTSSYMESVNDAYVLAKITGDKEHEEKYKESIIIGTGFILETQYTPENSYGLDNSELAVGGFKQSLTNGYIRNDFVQHAISSIMKSYNNRVFE